MVYACRGIVEEAGRRKATAGRGRGVGDRIGTFDVVAKATKFVMRASVSGSSVGVVDSCVKMRKRWFWKATG